MLKSYMYTHRRGILAFFLMMIAAACIIRLYEASSGGSRVYCSSERIHRSSFFTGRFYALSKAYVCVGNASQGGYGVAG